MLNQIEERVRYFFMLATLVRDEDGCLEESSIEWGIHSMGDWKKHMDEELKWLYENENEVLINLARLRKEWPACCDALEKILLAEV